VIALHSIPIDPIFLQIVLKLAHSLFLALLVFLSVRLLHYVLEKYGGVSRGSTSNEAKKKAALEELGGVSRVKASNESEKKAHGDWAFAVLGFAEKTASTFGFVMYLGLKTVLNVRGWLSH